MSKFKIGDKVRCIYSDEEKGCGWFLGKEFIVDSLNSTSSDICYFPKNENGVYENGLELVEDTLLGVGDVIEMIERQDEAEIGMIGTIRGVGINIKGSYQIEFSEGFEGHSCDGLISDERGHYISFRRVKLVISEDKLIKKNMEIDEIKKINKSILAEANAEVLKEISNSQKAVAMEKLRELYDRKLVTEEMLGEVTNELKDITKDLKTLTTK